MYMVGHQYIGMNVTSIAVSSIHEQRQIQLIVFLLKERY